MKGKKDRDRNELCGDYGYLNKGWCGNFRLFVVIDINSRKRYNKISFGWIKVNNNVKVESVGK